MANDAYDNAQTDKEILEKLRPQETIDYRALLKAYMDNVIDNEGSSYVGFIGFNGEILTDEQTAELKVIEKELETDGKNYTVKRKRYENG